MITSLQNGTIKRIIQLKSKSKVRKKEQLFVVEGKKSVSEAKKEDIERFVVSEKFIKENEHYANKIDCNKLLIVNDTVFKHISDAVTPQGILALVKIRSYNLSDLIVKPDPIILLLEDIQDPGNLGTIIRTADAVKADGVLLSKGAVDAYSPKTVRSTMGSLFHIPLLDGRDLKSDIAYLQENKIQILAAHLKGKQYLYDFDMSQPLGLLIGNEGRGLSEEIADMADQFIKIPMLGDAESLNAGVAASILMYEAVRQRLKL